MESCTIVMPPSPACAVLLRALNKAHNTGKCTTVWASRHVEADRPCETPEGNRGAEETGRRCDRSMFNRARAKTPDKQRMLCKSRRIYTQSSERHRDDGADAGGTHSFGGK